MKKLKDKVALITGAGSGMGKAIAILFAKEGGKVVATDINKERLTLLQKDIEKSGGEVTTLIANMSVEADINNMFEVALSQYGTLDILVNNAGIMDNFSPVGELENEVWEKVIAINLTGPFQAMRKAINIFLPKEKGVIINIASVAGLRGGRAGAAYTASKHGLIGLTKNTGHVYAKTGIRCNAIAPGAIETNIGETIDMTRITPIVNERIMEGMGLNPRSAKPEEIAKIALFLASDDASFVNGHVVVADGGWIAH
ncbi:MAG TPA: 3-ketoacyl-ACP reductase [Cytophagales bacterium]|nr:3-ketoacyl-ACP reductase [Cytophagales bacterium]